MSERDIKNVWTTLEQYFGPVSANVEFTDNIERKAESLEQLLSFENSTKRSIRRVEFTSMSENGENRSKVTFESYEHRPVRITASGIDDVITRFSDSCEEIVDGLKPWYSRFCKLDFFYIIGGIFIIGLFLLLIMLPDSTIENHSELSEAIVILTTSSTVVAALLLLIWGLNKVREKCFPIATFAIGQGKERHRVIENIRWGVVVAFAVSFSASAVFSFLV
ncbi:MAG: hypothetical protein AAGJ37_03625 [Pseudomonadota bacterium]